MPNDEMDPEDIALSAAIYRIAAPMCPTLVDHLQQVDQNIVGGFLLAFRANGELACMVGNTPPSVTIPILKRAIEMLGSADAQLVETAFADDRKKAN